MNASVWARAWTPGSSVVLKVWNFQNTKIDHKLRKFHTIFYLLHTQRNYSLTSIAVYNLFMHSSLTNQKGDILLSIQ